MNLFLAFYSLHKKRRQLKPVVTFLDCILIASVYINKSISLHKGKLSLILFKLREFLFIGFKFFFKSHLHLLQTY